MITEERVLRPIPLRFKTGEPVFDPESGLTTRVVAALLALDGKEDNGAVLSEPS